MKQPNSPRRGFALGLSVLTVLATAAVGVVTVADRDDGAVQQRDYTLTATENAADVAHNALIAAQVAQNDSLFNQDVVGLQQSLYYWVGQPTADGGLGLDAQKVLFVDPSANPLSTGLFNGAFTRFAEANLVGQAIQQAQLDHTLGVNQTLGGPDGTDVNNLYEMQIADSLHDNIAGSGTTGSPIATDLTNLMTVAAGTDGVVSASGFHSALVDLQGALWQSGFSDMLGMFTASSGGAAADALSAFDLPL